ncbi:MAG TPA: hypothetical protein VL119_01830 [Acidimicrobiia bacterium]|nr:hypothetical protein [Acidimicrobiia bacterium]
MPATDEITPSGNEAFDRARGFLARLREDEALDWFQVAADDADDPAIRASAAAFVAGILLARGRPWEVGIWAEIVRDNSPRPDLGDLLEAAAHLQLGDVAAARSLLERVTDPTDPWFPSSATAARVARAHVMYLGGEIEAATIEVLAAFDADPFAPDVWDAFARLCAETDFDPAGFVERVPDDRVLGVLAALRASAPRGVDRIAELIWARNLGDPRVLALVPSFAAKLDSLRAMEWSARIRAAGMGRLCPLIDRAGDRRVDTVERARSAMLAHASFGDGRARAALADAVAALSDEELVPVLQEVWAVAAMLAETVVVAGATTPARSMRIASVLFQGGARGEAYSVLVHGLSLESADDLTTDTVVELLPLPVLEGLATEAEARGEQDVAGILEAVAVVSSGR